MKNKKQNLQGKKFESADQKLKKIITAYSETFFCILEGEWFENFFFFLFCSFFMYVCNYLWSRNEPTWKGENTETVATKVQPRHHQAWGNFMSILAHTIPQTDPYSLETILHKGIDSPWITS